MQHDPAGFRFWEFDRAAPWDIRWVGLDEHFLTSVLKERQYPVHTPHVCCMLQRDLVGAFTEHTSIARPHVSMITVQHISKRYGTHTALRDVTFHVDKGEILAFLGPNGAGKTTTMRILACAMPPSEGRATVAGFACLEQPVEVKRRLGYLPETPPLYQELTVDEYLTFAGRLKGLTSQRLASRKANVIDQVELGDVHHRVIGHLSRGYRQRVGLAQALIHDPPVLILDEPTVGLDPKQIIAIRTLIKSLATSHTIILSTHVLSEATAVCDRVVIIHQGRIVAEDTPEQLSARLRQSETMSLTVKQPTPDWQERLKMLPGVLNVFPGSTPHTCTIDCHLQQDLRDTLSQFVVSQGYGLLELKPLSLSLEDVFLRLTQQDETLGTDASDYPDPSSSSQPYQRERTSA